MARKILAFVVLYLSFSNVAFPQWIKLNTGTAMSINSIFFTSYDTGYAAGGIGWGIGIILKTTDGGMNWSQQMVTHNLLSVHFPTPDTGYAVGEGGTIMKTTDAGANWSYQNSGTTYQLTSVDFLNGLLGYASGCCDPGPNIVLKTTDGGISWIDLADSIPIGGWSIFFVSKDTGFTAGYQFFRTTNAGASWDTLSARRWNDISSVYFIDANRTLCKTLLIS